jgi:hypothetical protein
MKRKINCEIDIYIPRGEKKKRKLRENTALGRRGLCERELVKEFIINNNGIRSWNDLLFILIRERSFGILYIYIYMRWRYEDPEMNSNCFHIHTYIYLESWKAVKGWISFICLFFFLSHPFLILIYPLPHPSML